MIFQLGKTKAADDDAVREETFRRWREASQRSQGEGDAIVETAPVASGSLAETKGVEWPDPRATISLTQEIERVELHEPLNEPIQTSMPEAPPRSTTSKLAQFVSSGLNATGLLQSSTRTTPKPVLKAAPPPQESIRLVEKPAPVLERRAPERQLPVVDDIKERFGSNVRSALGPGTIIEGTFSFDSPVCIEGTLIGEVRSNSVLIVGAQATVNAKVKVGSLVVLGTVKGDVEAEELVEIKNGGSLHGDVFSERFAIEDGGWFQGRCTPTPSKKSADIELQVEAETADTQISTAIPAAVAAVGSSADKWSMD
ncbi:MAG: polymer-forming cytoskeletal protein [Bdellovibrionota bacterium]